MKRTRKPSKPRKRPGKGRGSPKPGKARQRRSQGDDWQAGYDAGRGTAMCDVEMVVEFLINASAVDRAKLRALTLEQDERRAKDAL